MTNDRRRRDFDNAQKGIWDALQHAGVYRDDSQIKRAVIEMHEPDGTARALATLKEFTHETTELQVLRQEADAGQRSSRHDDLRLATVDAANGRGRGGGRR